MHYNKIVIRLSNNTNKYESRLNSSESKGKVSVKILQNSL